MPRGSVWNRGAFLQKAIFNLKMKKTTIFGAVLAGLMAFPMASEAASNLTNRFYDFSAWGDGALIDLFQRVASKGRMFPTAAEFEEAGFPAIELEFNRSHVRQSAILPEKKIVSSAPSDRRMWFNVPTGQGKETAGYPSGEFHSDVFTGWNYTSVHGGWNHSAFKAPGAWTSAAHKNGAQMIGGIYFFDSTYGDTGAKQEFQNHMKKFGAKNSDGVTFTYLDAVVNCILYFGFDGVQYNMEAGTCFSGYNSVEKNFREFWQAVRKKLAEYGVNAFVGAYQPASSIFSSAAQYYVGTAADGQIFDVFMNYSGGGFDYSSANNNYEYAKASLGHGHGIYQGVWYNSLDSRGWPSMVNKQIDICPWGEHSVSRLFEFVQGNSIMELQDRYQVVTERFMSGGEQHPLDLPVMNNAGNKFNIEDADENDEQLATWGGIAQMIPERAVIKQNLPFNTNFSLGNGEFYFYKGKKTMGSWYNMGQQDYVPTYRWLVTPINSEKKASHDVKVAFDHRDAYIGGNALKLSGNAEDAANADVIVYRAALTVNGPVTATLAVKNGKENASDSHLKLIVRKEGSSNWIEVPYGRLEGKTWESKKLEVSGLAPGDVIEYIGFRVEGMPKGESIYVGQVLLDDNTTVACAPIDVVSLVTDVKEETNKNMTIRMAWSVKDDGFDCPAKERGMVFNSDVNIDHFEIFYKFGLNGKVQEVGRTTTWHAMIPNFDVTKSKEDIYVGVRSVSVDCKTASPIVWQQIQRNPLAVPSISDIYGQAYDDPYSDNWEIAINFRWIERLKTTGAVFDLDYQSQTTPFSMDDPLVGYHHADDMLMIAPNNEINFFIKGASATDDIQYCKIWVYIDYDCNGDFYGADEKIIKIGRKDYGASYPADKNNREDFVNNGYNITVKIPGDVVPGTSRMRIIAGDAWKSIPGPVGAIPKGNVLDFDVRILDAGQTPRAASGTYAELQDEGEADDAVQVGVDDITIGDESANMSVYPAVATDVINFTDVEKAWIYNMAGQMVKYVAAPQGAVSVTDLAAGVYVVKMQNGQVVRSDKIVKK